MIMMKIVAKTPRDFVISFKDEDFKGLTQKEKYELISKAVKEIVLEEVSWSEVKERIAL